MGNTGMCPFRLCSGGWISGCESFKLLEDEMRDFSVICEDEKIVNGNLYK